MYFDGVVDKTLCALVLVPGFFDYIMALVETVLEVGEDFSTSE